MAIKTYRKMKKNAVHVLKGKNIQELTDFFTGIGEPEYRADQAFLRINKYLGNDPNDFTEFPLHLRQQLSDLGSLPQLQKLHHYRRKRKWYRKNHL